ncbi:ornithine cyclodeaminase family protein [Kribbella sp. GL6]|uniref:ornithine cyclodeaminase family protein n=1 Tax=Kribbella sp. GL6 TaxID=3419765 RepID=UPI003D030DBD
MPEVSQQVAQPAPSRTPNCLVLSAADVTEALASVDLTTALEHALITSPSDDARRFRQLVAVDSGAFHIVGGTAQLSGAELLGLKVNGRYDSGRMRGTMLLVDASTGALTGLMDSAELTAARTAAMAAIAVRHLAPQPLSHALLIGTGRLARPIIRALRSSTDVRRIDVWGRDPLRAKSVAADFDDVHVAHDLAPAARVIVTATSATAPVLKRVAPGTLVVAVGSDAPTKQELPAHLLAESAVVVDSLEQCLTHGELRSAVAAGLITADDVAGELADIIRAGRDPRSHPDQPVVADLTGIALQDVVAARTICTEAHRRGLGTLIQLRA